MAPSLATETGKKVTTNVNKCTVVWKTEPSPLQTVVLHCETLETLKLRRIPVPQQLISDFFSLQAANGGGSAAANARNNKLKRDREKAEEPLQQPQQQVRRTNETEKAAAVVASDSDDDEVVDLTALEA
jgi:hypothetical protein